MYLFSKDKEPYELTQTELAQYILRNALMCIVAIIMIFVSGFFEFRYLPFIPGSFFGVSFFSLIVHVTVKDLKDQHYL